MGIIINPTTGQIDFTGSGGGGGPSVATRTVVSFNTVDWVGPSAGKYTLTILRTTHNKTANPNVSVYELVSGSYEPVAVDTIKIDASGNITLELTETPDLRFQGIVVVM